MNFENKFGAGILPTPKIFFYCQAHDNRVGGIPAAVGEELGEEPQPHNGGDPHQGHANRNAITTDGAPGALKAIATTWSDTKVQRCLIYVRRDTVRDLTLHPRTAQGRALPGLSRKLLTITTTDRAAHRPAALNDYATEYRTWLNQRTTAQDDPATAAATGRKWWYTHPRTRRAHRRLEHLARQGVLFTYLTHDPALERTTNPVESINARIRDNLRHHRGATPDHQAAIAEWTLHTHTRQPADPQQILTAWHAQGRPPRRRIPTTPTNARTRPAGWGTTPTPEEGLWTRKGWAGRTH